MIMEPNNTMEEDAEIGWIQKSYEYSLSEETCLRCNQGLQNCFLKKL